MPGLQSLLGRPEDPDQDQIRRVSLALHHLTYSGEVEITVNDLASATDLPITIVLVVVSQLERRRLVKIRPWEGERLAPVDWMQSTKTEQLQLMGRTGVDMTPFLPGTLEGELDYSPAADEAIVAAIIDPIEPEDFPNPEELVGRIDLPPRRAREAIARYMRGPLDAGVRMRVTMDITFPDMILRDGHNTVHEVLAQIVELIAKNDVVRCEDVRLRAAESISLTE